MSKTPKSPLLIEMNTIQAMISLFCRKEHHAEQLCSSCRELFDYSISRLELCRYRNKKPACSHCNIHCYKPEMRNRMKQVMRFSGPRMLLYHPCFVIRRLISVILSSKRIREYTTYPLKK